MLRFHHLLGAIAPGVLTLCAAPAMAQASAPAPDATGAATDDAHQITVTGYRFLDVDTSGITSLPLPIDEVPQSISVVNNDFLKAADIDDMGEVAQYTPGALWASYSPSYGNQIWLRGFAANYAYDGLLVGDQITEPDPVTLQRFEIVKGPASVVYGAQGPGGVVDIVSKAAAAATPSYLQALGGSFGRWRLEGQFAHALDRSGSIRAIVAGAHEQGGSFVDEVRLNRSVVYAGLDADIAAGLTGYVRGSYQRTKDTPYDGIPTFPDGTLVPLPRAFFVGASDLTNTTHARRVETGFAWRPSPLWAFDLKSVYQDTTHDGGNVYPYDYIGFDGSFPIGGERFDDWRVRDLSVAGTATRKLDDLRLPGSSLVASVRYQHYRYLIAERNLTAGIANVFDGDGAVSDVFNGLQPVPGGYQQDQRMDFVTASGQAVLKVANPLTLVGGVAWSKPTIDLQVYNGPFRSFDPGHQVNWRGAAILEPVRGLNLYASYSESYQPNLRIDVAHQVLPPVEGQQYEVGAKYAAGDRLLLTAALFQIREDNVAVYDGLVDGEALYRASAVRHRGLELEGTGHITRGWQVKGGVALLDPKVVDDPNNPINDGERRPWLPKVTASLFTSYDFANGVSIAGGLRHSGSVRTYDRSSARATPDIAAYTLFDAAIAYTVSRWRLQLNLKNLADKRYYVGTPIFQSLTAGLYPGEPRSVAVSLRRDF